MRQSSWRFPVSLGKSARGLWPGLGPLVSFLPHLQVPLLCRIGLNHVLLQTSHPRAVGTKNDPQSGRSFLTPFIPKPGSGTALRGSICSQPHTYQIPEHLKWEQFQTNPTCWPQTDRAPRPTGFLYALENCFSGQAPPAWEAGCLRHLIHSLHFVFRDKRNRVLKSSLDSSSSPEVTKALPIHITAAELYYVALKERGKWSEIWELGRDKDRWFSADKWRDVQKKWKRYGQSKTVWQLLHSGIEFSQKAEYSLLLCILADHSSLPQMEHMFLYIPPNPFLTLTISTAHIHSFFDYK